MRIEWVNTEHVRDLILTGVKMSSPLLFQEHHESGMLRYMFPELDAAYDYDQLSPYHSKSLWEHTMATVYSIPKDRTDLRIAGLFHDLGKPAVAKIKPFNRTAVVQDPEMQRMRDAYQGDFQQNFVGHEFASALIADRYLKWIGYRRSWIVKTVREHMKPESPLKPYDRDAH